MGVPQNKHYVLLHFNKYFKLIFDLKNYIKIFSYTSFKIMKNIKLSKKLKKKN